MRPVQGSRRIHPASIHQLWLLKTSLSLIYHHINTIGPLPRVLDDVLRHFIRLRPTSKKNILLGNLIGAALWSLSLETNDRTFQGGGKSLR